MSTTSKKPNITEEEYEKLQSTDDLYREYDEYLRTLRQQLDYRKKGMVDDVVDNGPELLQEIDKKQISEEEYTKRNKNFFAKFISMMMGW